MTTEIGGIFTPPIPGGIYATEAELAVYPADGQKLIRDTHDQGVAEYRFLTEETYAVKQPDGSFKNFKKSDDSEVYFSSPVGRFFSLSYASWFVVPRLILQEMPLSWQARFVALMDEVEEHGPEVSVSVVGGDNRFVNDEHWRNYRRGSVAEAKDIDAAREERRLANKEAKRQANLQRIEAEIAVQNAGGWG